jgi:hypothetical protein
MTKSTRLRKMTSCLKSEVRKANGVLVSCQRPYALLSLRLIQKGKPRKVAVVAAERKLPTIPCGFLNMGSSSSAVYGRFFNTLV